MGWPDAGWLKNKIISKLIDVNTGLINKLSSNENNIKTAISNSETNIKNNSNSNRDNIKTAINNSQTTIINNNNTNKENIKDSINNATNEIKNNSNSNKDSIKDKLTDVTNTITTVTNSVNTLKNDINIIKNNTQHDELSGCLNCQTINLGWTNIELTGYGYIVTSQISSSSTNPAVDNNGVVYIPYMIIIHFNVWDKDSEGNSCNKRNVNVSVQAYLESSSIRYEYGDAYPTYYFVSTTFCYDVYDVNGVWLKHGEWQPWHEIT